MLVSRLGAGSAGLGARRHPCMPRWGGVRQQWATRQPRASLQRRALPDELYGGQERVLDLKQLLKECEELDEEDEEDAPVWELEHKLQGTPLTPQDLAKLRAEEAQEQPPLFPDPLQAVTQVANAYSAEEGFREMSAEELSVALTAGGLVDLLLDVRSEQEVAAGPVIPGSLNIPLERLSDAVRAGQLDPYMAGSVAVVCASGLRSAQATVRLSRVFNFQHVSNVAGGMAAWQRLQQQRQQPEGGGGCGCGSGGSGGCHK